MTKTISVDLDGVLNIYNGHYDENIIPPIRDGAKYFLEKISNEYLVEIFTVRKKRLVKKWLKDNNISQYICNISNLKNPFATIFIDDRAINFTGNYEYTLQNIVDFKPYWK